MRGVGDYVQRVDDSGNVTEDGQQDVDEEVGIAATLKEDTKRGQNNGEDDLDDVAASRVSRRSPGRCDTPPRRLSPRE